MPLGKLLAKLSNNSSSISMGIRGAGTATSGVAGDCINHAQDRKEAFRHRVAGILLSDAQYPDTSEACLGRKTNRALNKLAPARTLLPCQLLIKS